MWMRSKIRKRTPTTTTSSTTHKRGTTGDNSLKMKTRRSYRLRKLTRSMMISALPH